MFLYTSVTGHDGLSTYILSKYCGDCAQGLLKPKFHKTLQVLPTTKVRGQIGETADNFENKITQCMKDGFLNAQKSNVQVIVLHVGDT